MPRVYRTPSFNQQCLIVRPGNSTLATICQVAGMTKLTTGAVPSTYQPTTNVTIKIPKGTAVRGALDGRADQIWVPDLTGTRYDVQNVWDVAQGFPNEYRMAACTRVGLLHS